MRFALFIILSAFFTVSATAQSFLQAMYNVDKSLGQAVAEKGFKPAFLEFLAEDAIIFRPEAVNGHEFLRNGGDPYQGKLRRSMTFADISTNGLLGYTTGEWTLTQKTKSGKPFDKIGQYATVWQKRSDGRYKAILDIETSHDPYDKKKKRRPTSPPPPIVPETNFRRISAADATMNFLKLSMTGKGLGGAYDKFADDEVRLLREGLPPIIGRGKAEEEMERYKAVDFPTRVSQFETADMAYSWNPCSYSDSNEGMEKGNCLHIWKLEGEKWRIVLGVFARVTNQTIPVLTEKSRPTK